MNPLQTVPEGSPVLTKDVVIHSMMFAKWGPRIVSVFVLGLLFMAGIKEWMNDQQQQQQQSSSSKMATTTGGGDGVDASLRRRDTDDRFIPNQEDDEDDEEEEQDNNKGDVSLPLELQFLQKVSDPLQPTDRALFWHVPRAGGSTVKQIAAHCFGLVVASEVGGNNRNQKLAILSDLEGGSYLNVDTTTPDGIVRAAELGVAEFPGLNVISTPHLYEAASQLFTDRYRARMFTMLRHPIERAASLFAFLAASQSNNNIIVPGMTLEDYAQSGKVETDWMVRFLTHTPDDSDVTVRHLHMAKNVLREYALIGFLEKKGESLRRFELYFGWQLDGQRMEDCHTKNLEWNWPSKHKHPPVREGSEAWKLLKKSNELDLQLYEYAQELFRRQSKLFAES